MPYDILIPIAILFFCSLAGVLVERIFKSKLTWLVKRSGFKSGEIIIGAFKGIIMLWFIMAGIYFSLLWAFKDENWMAYATKIFISITILIITIVFMRMASGLVRNYSKKAEGVLPSTSIFANLTKAFVVVIGLLIMLSYLGISITPMLTALGVGGLAVALALQDTLSNVFAGIQILLSRQIKPGDYVHLESGEEGFVTDISWRNTSIRMMSNNLVIIPNSKLSDTIVINYELPEREMSVLVGVGVAYSSDLEIVERVVCEVGCAVMNEVPGGVKGFVPYIRFNTFSDSRIDFSVILRTTSFSDQYMVKHEFIKRLHKRFNTEGIEIPFPVRTIYMKEEG